MICYLEFNGKATILFHNFNCVLLQLVDILYIEWTDDIHQ